MIEEENKATVAIEVAGKEIKEWLDFKKIDDIKRVKLSESIQDLIMAVYSGILVVNTETKEITQKLKFPIGQYTELKYKARVQMSEIQQRTAVLQKSDMIGTSFAYAAAVTGVSPEILKQLDSEDFGIMDRIVFFFMA